MSEVNVKAPCYRLRMFELIEVNKEWSLVKYSLMKLSMLNSWYAVVFGVIKRNLSNQALKSAKCQHFKSVPFR